MTWSLPLVSLYVFLINECTKQYIWMKTKWQQTACLRQNSPQYLCYFVNGHLEIGNKKKHRSDQD